MEATTGFVLAGGGFKGAFELGVLRYLVDDLGITPDVIASASAGSILGMVMAQGRTAAEFGRQLENAQETLLAMTQADQVFGRQEWLGEFDGTDFAARVVATVMDRSSPEVPGGDPDPDRIPGTGSDHDADGPDRHEPDDEPDDDEPHGRHWSELTKLRDQLRAAARARRTLTGTTSSVLTLDPFERAIRGEVDVGIPAVEPALVARPGLELRMAVTAVKARRPTTSARTAPSSGPMR